MHAVTKFQGLIDFLMFFSLYKSPSVGYSCQGKQSPSCEWVKVLRFQGIQISVICQVCLTGQSCAISTLFISMLIHQMAGTWMLDIECKLFNQVLSYLLCLKEPLTSFIVCSPLRVRVTKSVKRKTCSLNVLTHFTTGQDEVWCAFEIFKFDVVLKFRSWTFWLCLRVRLL